MDYTELSDDLQISLQSQKEKFDKSLILNPVENIPDQEFLFPCTSFLHGLYGSDSIKTKNEKQNTKILFSHRDAVSKDLNKIYKTWADLLKADTLSMRLLSGLHAHIIIFMSLANPGDKILLLPEIAGGHMSTAKILARLGLDVVDFIIDENKHCINIEESKKLIERIQPDFIFVDRSEGLYYEDFSWLSEYKASVKIFDASQYLTNIIARDYKNPFDMGFDFVLSTLHKNLPGPQRALVCARKQNLLWQKLKQNMSLYVSNMHVFTIYSAGLMLKDWPSLKRLSKNMLENVMLLEKELSKTDLRVLLRDTKLMQTHHLWLQFEKKENAFDFYLDMERCGFLVNYRLLPYNLGYGIRIGTSAATYSGLRPSHIENLAKFISIIHKKGYSRSLSKEIEEFIKTIKK